MQDNPVIWGLFPFPLLPAVSFVKFWVGPTLESFLGLSHALCWVPASGFSIALFTECLGLSVFSLLVPKCQHKFLGPNIASLS